MSLIFRQNSKVLLIKLSVRNTMMELVEGSGTRENGKENKGGGEEVEREVWVSRSLQNESL